MTVLSKPFGRFLPQKRPFGYMESDESVKLVRDLESIWRQASALPDTPQTRSRAPRSDQRIIDAQDPSYRLQELRQEVSYKLYGYLSKRVIILPGVGEETVAIGSIGNNSIAYKSPEDPELAALSRVPACAGIIIDYDLSGRLLLRGTKSDDVYTLVKPYGHVRGAYEDNTIHNRLVFVDTLPTARQLGAMTLAA